MPTSLADSEGQTPLHIASKFGAVRRDTHPRLRTCTCKHAHTSTDLRRHALARTASKFDRRATPAMMTLCHSLQAELMRALVEHGAAVNVHDKQRMSPLALCIFGLRFGISFNNVRPAWG